MPRPQSLRHRYRAAVMTAGLLCVALGGCTPFSNFPQQCTVASRTYAGAADPAGCWEGTWKSHQSSHNGCLKAIITRCDATHYQVRFHATFFKFLSYEYTITLAACEAGGVYHFTGQKDLGKLAGGMYYYTGTTTGNQFTATYRSCKDHGVFVMCRKACSPCCR